MLTVPLELLKRLICQTTFAGLKTPPCIYKALKYIKINIHLVFICVYPNTQIWEGLLCRQQSPKAQHQDFISIA